MHPQFTLLSIQCWILAVRYSFRMLNTNGVLTGNSGAPFTQTLSAKRTRFGRVRSLARFPADKSVDFRPGQLVIAGWHTSKLTCVSHERTNWITWSRGASFTSSPFTANMRSPGSNCNVRYVYMQYIVFFFIFYHQTVCCMQWHLLCQHLVHPR